MITILNALEVFEQNQPNMDDDEILAEIIRIKIMVQELINGSD